MKAKIKTFAEITASPKVFIIGDDDFDEFVVQHDESRIEYTSSFEDDLPEDRIIDIEEHETDDHYVTYLDGEKYYIDDYMIDDNYNH